MTELELTRSPHDRRLYVLDRVGTLRLEGLSSRSAVARAGGETWHLARSGFWGRVIGATDVSSTCGGECVPRDLLRGDKLYGGGRQRPLRPASRLRDRCALADGGRELALLD